MLTAKLLSQGYQKTKPVATLKKFYGRHHDLVNPCNVAVSRIVSDVFANDQPQVDFQNPGHMLLPTFPSFRSMGMVGKTCLPSNAYYPQAPDYTLYSGVHIYWSEHSDSSFIYGFMSLNYCLGTMTATTFIIKSMLHFRKEYTLCHDLSLLVPSFILSNKKLNQKSQDTVI